MKLELRHSPINNMVDTIRKKFSHTDNTIIFTDEKIRLKEIMFLVVYLYRKYDEGIKPSIFV